MLPELQRTRFITENYNTLRGLIIVPGGFGIFLFGAWGLWLQQLLMPHGLSNNAAFIIQFILFCLLMSCIFGLTHLITKYYDHTFGKIEYKDNKAEQKQTVWMFLIVLCSVGAAFDTAFHPPVSVTGLLIAILFFIRWWSLERVPTHYLVVALLMALISIFPSIDGQLYQQWLAYKNEFYTSLVYVLIGPLIMICGILDHLILVHTLAPHSKEPEDEAKWK